MTVRYSDGLGSNNEKKGTQWLHKSRLGSSDGCEKGDGTRQGAGLASCVLPST